MPTVDIGIPCSKNQSPHWWQPVLNELLAEVQSGVKIRRVRAIMTASPEHNKNLIVDDRRMSRTDMNRTEIAGGFLQGDSEWLWFMDDDTVPPQGALSRLLKIGSPAVAGLYFIANYPFAPQIYTRRQDGRYDVVYDYPSNSVIQVDSCGLGCALLHRSVFEDIRKNFAVFRRPNGSLIPIHKNRFDAASSWAWASSEAKEERVEGRELIIPLSPVNENELRYFPFFAMEYGRTEDHHFWELAAQVGYKPIVDTGLLCRHWREQDYGVEHHRAVKEKMAKAAPASKAT